MTNRDFVLIARVLRPWTAHEGAQLDGVLDKLAEDFADALAQANPRFDRARFLKDCGVTA